MFGCSKQLLEQVEVDVVPQLDKDRGVTLDEFKLIKVHMTNCKSKVSHLFYFFIIFKIDKFRISAKNVISTLSW